jgi:hypothetical protein
MDFGLSENRLKNTLPCAITKTHRKHMGLPCAEIEAQGKVFLKE